MIKSVQKRGAKTSRKKPVEKPKQPEPPQPRPPWNYHELIANAIGVISDWKAKQPVALKAKFDRVLDQLRQMPKGQWHKPAPASALGDHIYVIRFTDVTKMQIRLFGHFFDAHSAFVITFDGYEKDDVYYPSQYKKLASSHKASCDAKFHVHTRKLEQRCRLCVDTVPVQGKRH